MRSCLSLTLVLVGGEVLQLHHGVHLTHRQKSHVCTVLQLNLTFDMTKAQI